MGTHSKENRKHCFFPFNDHIGFWNHTWEQEDFRRHPMCWVAFLWFSSVTNRGDQPCKLPVSFSFLAFLSCSPPQSGLFKAKWPPHCLSFKLTLCHVLSCFKKTWTPGTPSPPGPSHTWPCPWALLSQELPKACPESELPYSSSPTVNYQNTWRVWIIHRKCFFFFFF